MYRILFHAVLLIICINGSLHLVIDLNFALAWTVVQIRDNVLHGYNGICREAIGFLDFLECALIAFSALHAI